MGVYLECPPATLFLIYLFSLGMPALRTLAAKIVIFSVHNVVSIGMALLTIVIELKVSFHAYLHTLLHSLHSAFNLMSSSCFFGLIYRSCSPNLPHRKHLVNMVQEYLPLSFIYHPLSSSLVCILFN